MMALVDVPKTLRGSWSVRRRKYNRLEPMMLNHRCSHDRNRKPESLMSQPSLLVTPYGITGCALVMSVCLIVRVCLIVCWFE